MKKYRITYVPRLRQRTVRTKNISKFLRRFSKGDCEKIYSVVDLKTFENLMPERMK